MASYDVFISYSHARDKPVAAALQSALQSLGKPWYRRRALRAFRDDTSLSATPQLWPRIEQALADSRFLIFLASPESAASPWVGKEVSYWLEHKSLDSFLIALTGGALAWDDAAGDFRWSEATPLPRALRGRFAHEPKWVDLTRYRGGASPRDDAFRHLCADFAAAVRGIPKEDLLSEELKQQRRALTLAWSAASALALLVFAAGWQWNAAVQQRDRAEAALAQADRNYAIALKGGAETVQIVRRNVEDGTISNEVTQALVEVSRRTVTNLETERAGEEIAAVQWRLLNTLRMIYLNMTAQAGQGLEMATRAREVAERLAARFPESDEHARSLVISNLGLADAYFARGEIDRALAQNRVALELAAKLIARKSENWRYKRDKGYLHQRVGDLLRWKGELDGAHAQYLEFLAEFEWLVRQDAPDPDWVRGHGLARQRLGDLMRDKGDLDAALAEYRRYRDIAASVAGTSKVRQLDLAIANQRIGDILLDKGDVAGALKAYQLFNEGTEDAVKFNRRNSEWQRYLANSYIKLGDATLARKAPREALKRFAAAADIYQQLLASDQRPQWQRSLALVYGRMGAAQQALGDPGGAMKYFEACLEMPVNEASIDLMLTTPRRVKDDCRARSARLLRLQ